MLTARTGVQPSKMLASQAYSKAVIAGFIILLVAASSTRAKEWRGIVPLHSTRADVELLLGPPTIDRSDGAFYQLKSERVSIDYSTGPCGVEPSRWNVPLDTVINIWVTPKPHSLRLADLKLNESKFKKETNDHVWHVVSYVNEAEGISYQVDTSADGMVTLIKYVPAAKDEHLRCPKTEEQLERTVKFDSYPDIPFESEKRRLDSFAEQVRRYTSTQAYIMVYAGRRARAGEAEARATRAKGYLVKERGIEAGRITTIDGGHQEELTVELYLVPPGARPPLPTPTVEPSEVQIIKAAEARKNSRRSTRARCK